MSRKMTPGEFVNSGYLYIVNSVLQDLGVVLTVNIAPDGEVIGFGDIQDHTGDPIPPYFDLRDPAVLAKRNRAVALINNSKIRQTRISVNL